MADNDQFSSETNRKAYEDMSRDELVSIIGIEDDAGMSRDELVMMAMQTEQNADNR